MGNIKVSLAGSTKEALEKLFETTIEGDDKIDIPFEIEGDFIVFAGDTKNKVAFTVEEKDIEINGKVLQTIKDYVITYEINGETVEKVINYKPPTTELAKKALVLLLKPFRPTERKSSGAKAGMSAEEQALHEEEAALLAQVRGTKQRKKAKSKIEKIEKIEEGQEALDSAAAPATSDEDNF